MSPTAISHLGENHTGHSNNKGCCNPLDQSHLWDQLDCCKACRSQHSHIIGTQHLGSGGITNSEVGWGRWPSRGTMAGKHSFDQCLNGRYWSASWYPITVM